MWWWTHGFNRPMDKAGDPPGGGGGGGNPPPKTDPPPKSDPPPPKAEDDPELAEFREWKKSKGDPDLSSRTAKDRADREKASAEHRALESAVTFNLTRDDFLKKNGALLPESVKDLFTKADTETYDSPVQKSAEIKSGMIQEFFALQENLDLLTASQRARVADFLKLTKDGKRERAQSTYDDILEPTIELLRAHKKTEQVNRARNGYGDDSDEPYKKKLMEHSAKHYLKKSGDK